METEDPFKIICDTLEDITAGRVAKVTWNDKAETSPQRVGVDEDGYPLFRFGSRKKIRCIIIEYKE